LGTLHVHVRTVERTVTCADSRTITNGEVIVAEWLTYQQAGRRLGISAEAARQRARRLRWTKRTTGTNEGDPKITLILVPDAEPKPVPEPGQSPFDVSVQPNEHQPGQSGQANGSAEVALLHALVGNLRDQLTKAETSQADAHARADRAETREAEARIVFERQGREMTAALLRTAIAETEARAAREAKDETRRELAEARRPAWRRWLGLP